MSADVHEFPRRAVTTSGGGGGPYDPTLDQRVAILEKKIDRIEVKLEKHDEALRRIEDALKALIDIREKVAHIDGRLNNIPTFWQTFSLMAMLLIGIAGLIFTASRFLHP